MVPLAGVVLCGGASRRMGTDKALVEFEGVPLVVRVANRLAEVADPVMLASGAGGRLTAALGELRFEEIHDDGEQRGPVAGLIAALTASPHELTAVVAGDMPFIDPDLLRHLCRIGTGSNDIDAVIPRDDHGLQPLHAVYRRRALPRLRAVLADGTRELKSAVANLNHRIVDAPGAYAFNVNDASDLRRATRMIDQGDRTRSGRASVEAEQPRRAADLQDPRHLG